MAGPAQQLAATEESLETENNWEGPFYKLGAPVRSELLERGMAGTPLTVTGRVLDTSGRPLKGALLDIGRPITPGPTTTPASGCGDGFYTGDDGRYTLRTIKPLHYGAPDDMRPAHIHVKASAGDSPILTTQLYFKGDPWNHHDPDVRPTLMMSPGRCRTVSLRSSISSSRFVEVRGIDMNRPRLSTLVLAALVILSAGPPLSAQAPASA